MIFMMAYDFRVTLPPLNIDTIIYVPMKIYVPMCQNRTLIFYDFYGGL